MEVLIFLMWILAWGLCVRWFYYRHESFKRKIFFISISHFLILFTIIQLYFVENFQYYTINELLEYAIVTLILTIIFVINVFVTKDITNTKIYYIFFIITYFLLILIMILFTFLLSGS